MWQSYRPAQGGASGKTFNAGLLKPEMSEKEGLQFYKQDLRTASFDVCGKRYFNDRA